MADLGKTEIRREEQYRDRWSSSGESTGLVTLSDRPTAAELKKIDIFQSYEEDFLNRQTPDIAIARWRAKSVLFEEGTYIDLAFYVLEGTVEVAVKRITAHGPSAAAPIFDAERTAYAVAREAQDPGKTVLARSPKSPKKKKAGPEITFLATMDFDLERDETKTLGPGEFFGEIGALSGWPQSVTAVTRTDCKLVQIRLPALKALKAKSSALKDRLDGLYRERTLASQLKSTPLFSSCSEAFLSQLKDKVQLISCNPGDVLVQQGATQDALFVVRSGFLKLSQKYAEGQLTVSYLSKGMTLGDVELMVAQTRIWESTAVSLEYSEHVKIPLAALNELLEAYPQIKKDLWTSGVDRTKEFNLSKREIGHPELIDVALNRGLVQGNSLLVIDLDVCTRCDDCVRACASTHEGQPRFVREGSKYHNLLIAKSCYHCRDPVCLVGCPTGAIHRAGDSAVVSIDPEICIGCSTCANNCPYDSIMMLDTGSTWPDNALPLGLRGKDRQLASKCDLCADTGHGPACVSNCPQGCAFRVGSLEDVEQLLKRRD